MLIAIKTASKRDSIFLYSQYSRLINQNKVFMSLSSFAFEAPQVGGTNREYASHNDTDPQGPVDELFDQIRLLVYMVTYHASQVIIPIPTAFKPEQLGIQRAGQQTKIKRSQKSRNRLQPEFRIRIR
jgi:hypothetical protein